MGLALVVLPAAAAVLLHPSVSLQVPLARSEAPAQARAPLAHVGQGMIAPPRRVPAPAPADGDEAPKVAASGGGAASASATANPNPNARGNASTTAPATAARSAASARPRNAARLFQEAATRLASRSRTPSRAGSRLELQAPVDALTAARREPERAPRPCPAGEQAPARIFVFPHRPVRGKPVRVVALSFRRADLQRLQLTLDGAPLEVRVERRPATAPYALVARLRPRRAGSLAVRVSGTEGPHATTACAERRVAWRPNPPPTWTRYPEVWPVKRRWDRFTEALFSAWVARLFHVSSGGMGGWRPLHQVTRDSRRNWLHNALGWAEDAAEGKARVVLMPDCGDLPYFLRAYFAWKLRLPLSFQRCTRGNAVTGPICPVARDNLTRRYSYIPNPVHRFNKFTREWIGWGVHSGTTRTKALDDDADFYPVALTRRALRPGRIFVDPSGHVFVIAQRTLGSRHELGVLYGVDAHPDRSISRKRFAPGTFVFNARVSTGGFKAFRPVRFENGRIRKLTNEEMARRASSADFSPRQSQFARAADFYAAVQHVLNPEPVDPRKMYRSKILALYEAVRERIGSVALGVAYMERTGWHPMPMPRGPAIFETTGPWEIYSTPARDLRLLMAIQDVLDFPTEMAQRAGPAGLYRIPDGWSPARLRRELRAVYDELPRRLRVRYRRSDGSRWTLRLRDVIQRRAALRRAYHPNDCPEVRWGAPPGSQERETCTHRAAKFQRSQMQRYEVWFRLLRRPPQRG